MVTGSRNLTMTFWNESILDKIIQNHILKSRELRVKIRRRVCAAGRTGPLTAPRRHPLLVILARIDRFQN